MAVTDGSRELNCNDNEDGIVWHTAVFIVVTQRCVTTLKTAVYQTNDGNDNGKKDLS